MFPLLCWVSLSYHVVIIARVDSIPENHHNLRVLLNALNLPSLSKIPRIVCDLKVMNILLGIQSCSCMHPCPYCFGFKVNKFGEKTNQKGRFNVGKPQTINTLREHFNLWVKETNSDRNQIKNILILNIS